MRLFLLPLAAITIAGALGHYLMSEEARLSVDPLLYGSEWVKHHRPEYGSWPVATFLHLIPGSALLALGLTQFSRRLRRRSPVLHRRLGWAYAVLGAFTSITAVVLATAIPFSGVRETVTTFFQSGFFLFALTQAVLSARRRNLKTHRAWMIRGYATLLAVSSLRIFYALFLNTTSCSARDFFAYSGWLGLAVNLLVAEVWIQYTRDRKI